MHCSSLLSSPCSRKRAREKVSLSPRCHRAPSASVFEYFREKLWRKKIASVALKIREFAPNNGRFFAAANAPSLLQQHPRRVTSINICRYTWLGARAREREIKFSFQDPITRCDTNTHTREPPLPPATFTLWLLLSNNKARRRRLINQPRIEVKVNREIAPLCALLRAGGLT